MRYLNRFDYSNAQFGIILLVLLALLVGPNVMPRLIASLPGVDEGVPCDWLRRGNDRMHHQSLLSRDLNLRTESPISLEVRTGRFPQDINAVFSITITVTNRTLAPVPILVTPDDLILDPARPQSGFGIVFNDAPAPNNGDLTAGGYPEERIRLLGPRQICVTHASIAVSQIANASALIAANATITAFYRNNARGEIPPSELNQPYTDQGLWTGIVRSSPYAFNEAHATTGP